MIATPGHTADSLSFLLRGPGPSADLLTGDTVLGRGSSVVAFPDGRLGAYLESLDRLSVVCGATEVARLLPGHGPVLDHPAEVLEAYKQHRQERLEQVAAAMRAERVRLPTSSPSSTPTSTRRCGRRLPRASGRSWRTSTGQ